ncbi:Hypothetical predicted protein [Cloeon dipterum]|uniref:Uncharacterized protein n=1 Tax=Cloeon dipterum TaxID=197152 RepID=A0A8S1CZP5_9INSE|nr:Hypothetical predicted protein [Cloeon dipterum]
MAPVNRDPRLRRAAERAECSSSCSPSRPSAITADADGMELAAAIVEDPLMSRGLNAMRRELHPRGLARRLIATSPSLVTSSLDFVRPSSLARLESVRDAAVCDAPGSSGADEGPADSTGEPSDDLVVELPSKQFDRLRRRLRGSTVRRLAAVRKQLVVQYFKKPPAGLRLISVRDYWGVCPAAHLLVATTLGRATSSTSISIALNQLKSSLLLLLQTFVMFIISWSHTSWKIWCFGAFLLQSQEPLGLRIRIPAVFLVFKGQKRGSYNLRASPPEARRENTAKLVTALSGLVEEEQPDGRSFPLLARKGSSLSVSLSSSSALADCAVLPLRSLADYQQITQFITPHKFLHSPLRSLGTLHSYVRAMPGLLQWKWKQRGKDNKVININSEETGRDFDICSERGCNIIWAGTRNEEEEKVEKSEL